MVRLSARAGFVSFALALASASAPTTAATASDSSESGTIEEVVVTAERRSESVQNTPLVVNVLSGADLVQAGATDVIRAGELVPGVHVITSGLGGAQIAVRGIVSNNVNVGSDPALAMSVDDVYIARSQAAMSSFFDVARIEVLKGPQGTLYGRNSVSGAMNIITNDPKHEWGANLSAEVGEYNSRTFAAAANIPLGEAVAVRVAGQSVQHDGYIDDYWSDEDNKAARIKVLAELSDTASMILSAGYSNQSGVGQLNPNYPFVGSDPWNPKSTVARGLANTDNDIYSASARLNWQTKIGDLTYIRGYSKFVEDYQAPPNGGLRILQRSGTSRQDTDELRLASTTRADTARSFAWVTGLFRYEENQDQLRHVEATLPFGNLFQNAGYPAVHAQSFALFAQGTYGFTDDLRITSGLRSTSESKNAIGKNDTTINGNFTSVPTAFTQSSDKLNYKLGAEYDLGDDSLLYASITTGFHGGGWQDGSGPTDSTYKPETITSYELGSKNEFLDHRLRANIGAYYYDYKDFLVGVTDTLAPTCACFTNAPKARAYGAELELEFALTRHDRVSFNLAYEDAKYTDFRIFAPFTSSVTGGRPIPAANGRPAGTDFSGSIFPYVSKYSGNVGYQHVFDLGNGGNIAAQVYSLFRTDYGAALGNAASLRQDGYTKTDVSLRYGAPQNWSVTAYVRNIENEPAIYSIATAVGGGPPITVGIGAPRTYGARVDYRF